MGIIKLLIACAAVVCAAGCKEDSAQQASSQESPAVKSTDPAFPVSPDASVYLSSSGWSAVSLPPAVTLPPETPAAPSSPVPEPATVILLAGGIGWIIARKRN